MGTNVKQEQKKRFAGKWQGLCLTLLLIGIAAVISSNALAEDKLLVNSKQNIYVDDTFDLSVCVDEKYKDEVEYTLPETYADLADINTDGVLHAKKVGNLIVEVTMTEELKEGDALEQEPQTIKETIAVTIIPTEKIELTYGEIVPLQVDKYISDYKYTLETDSDSVRIDGEGYIQAVGFSSAKINAISEVGNSFLLAEVTVAKPSIASERVVRAKGSKKFTVAFSNYKAVGGGKEHSDWSVKNKKIARWTEQGLEALAKGETVLTITITAYNGETMTITKPLVVTDPKLSANTIILASHCKKSVSVKGTVKDSVIDWERTQSGCAYFTEKGEIYGSYKGTRTLYLIVDGMEFAITVRVSNPTYNNFSIILHKGMSQKLNITGLVKGSKISYSSNKKSVVTITKSGKMKGKKAGHAIITVKADGRTMKLWTEVASKNGYKASKKAISISKTKTKYSQARRMSKGFYDCSSLVSRVYRNYGVYFGSRRGWSPVAADIGKWCVRNHKVVAKKGVSYKKLLPGDLIFFSSKKNGRYKNITHVEMYVGGAKDVSASSIYNKVVHYGYTSSSSIVLITRPTK